MKSQERHKLKENAFANTVVHAREAIAARQRDIVWAVAVVVGLLAIVGGYAWWRQSTAGRGTELFATALAVYQAPVIPLPPPTPGGAPPVPQPGTYVTEQAKLEAALPKFIEAADKYPSTSSGIAARYHAASILATLGRYGEAEQRFQEVVAKAGTTLYARTGRLGLAETQVAQKKYDSAITIYTEMSRDTSSQMPVDGVLMQLGRACALAGRKEEAVRAFTRVTEEFPTSLYATDAKRELEGVRKS
ncbi:MAG TPA: tetratricopeptide repeat protein [Dehalococcoidia bacterium]